MQTRVTASLMPKIFYKDEKGLPLTGPPWKRTSNWNFSCKRSTGVLIGERDWSIQRSRPSKKKWTSGWSGTSDCTQLSGSPSSSTHFCVSFSDRRGACLPKWKRRCRDRVPSGGCASWMTKKYQWIVTGFCRLGWPTWFSSCARSSWLSSWNSGRTSVHKIHLKSKAKE